MGGGGATRDDGVTRDDLVRMLAPTLGTDKSIEVVAETARRLGLGHVLSREQAMHLLDHIAQADGLVGIVGNLARSRFRLEVVRRGTA